MNKPKSNKKHRRISE